MFKKAALLSLCLLLPVSAAHAATNAAASPVYVFGSFNYDVSALRGAQTDHGQEESTVVQRKKQGNYGGELGVGYKFSPNLAAELTFDGASSRTGSFGAERGDFKGGRYGVRAGVLGLMPLSDRFTVFAKASIGYQHSSYETGDTFLMSEFVGGKTRETAKGKWGVPGLSAGATYQLTERLALRGEYEYRFDKQTAKMPSNNKTVAETLSRNNGSTVKVGLQYAF